MDRPIEIVVVDDHPLFREGVARTLAECEGLAVVAEGASADDAVRLAEEHRPDIMLLDISMPGGGVNAVVTIAARFPDINLAMLTVSEAEDDVMDALKAGALGYILKGVSARELCGIVTDIANGRSYVAPSLAARLLKVFNADSSQIRPQDRLADLSRREEQILRLVAQGLSNKEVALTLDLQEKTVKHYMTAILQKLHVRNRVEAAVLAHDVWDRRDRSRQ